MAADAPATMRIEVCVADAGHTTRIALTLPPGATLADAIAASGIDRLAERLEPAGDLVPAVHGRRATPAQPLSDGDRVELLRPLLVDPKLARMRRVQTRRAEQGRTKGGQRAR